MLNTFCNILGIHIIILVFKHAVCSVLNDDFWWNKHLNVQVIHSCYQFEILLRIFVISDLCVVNILSTKLQWPHYEAIFNLNKTISKRYTTVVQSLQEIVTYFVCMSNEIEKNYWISNVTLFWSDLGIDSYLRKPYWSNILESILILLVFQWYCIYS